MPRKRALIEENEMLKEEIKLLNWAIDKLLDGASKNDWRRGLETR